MPVLLSIMLLYGFVSHLFFPGQGRALLDSMRHLSFVTNPAIEAENCSFSTAFLPGTCFSLVEVILSGSRFYMGVRERERGKKGALCVPVGDSDVR